MYKMKITAILVSILLLVFTACDSRKADEKKADERLKLVELLINENSLNGAKIQIDSIHLLFPKLVSKRKIAAAFHDTIVRRESYRTLAYCDSILPIKQLEADSILKSFRLEKDPNYQKFGNYVPKTQRTEANATRNYLKAYVDENADFYLISNYNGGKIEHTTVKVSVNDVFVQTNIVDQSVAANHNFTVDGNRWEIVTFKNEAENGVAAFISQFKNDRIKVTLEGEKKYIYYLSDVDKKAIAESYNLWIVEKDLKQLKIEIKKAKTKIERINARKSQILTETDIK